MLSFTRIGLFLGAAWWDGIGCIALLFASMEFLVFCFFNIPLVGLDLFFIVFFFLVVFRSRICEPSGRVRLGQGSLRISFNAID